MKIRLEIRSINNRCRSLRYETEAVDYLIPSTVWAILKEEYMNPKEPWEQLMKTNQLVIHDGDGVIRIFELLNGRRLKSLKCK